jgi:Replication initiator protein A
MTTTFDARYRDGRDEMNLADFPISALQRAQKGDGAGGKLDRMEFTATRYDASSRQRVAQKVTLTSTACDGLPTPADEHVILALLYVAKHSMNFREATVHFAPSQLFEIMGWAPNGRSYTRLRDVLRRLKSLTIRYENAWWDVVGRAYEEEVATGILSGYRIARQVSGPRKAGQELMSTVTWTQAFQDSLERGNLKRLNLKVFFELQTPTAQRMYRFLDKRFYTQPNFAMDLVEFACGHVGLAETNNVAILKRRLTPGIAELEKIGFIRPAPAAERYEKLQVGQWRILFQSVAQPVALPSPTPVAPVEAIAPPEKPPAEVGPATDLAREFYRLWDASAPAFVGPRDVEAAAGLLMDRAPEEARAILALLVEITRKQWARCRSFSGAAQKYLPDALRQYGQNTRRAAQRQEAEQQRQQSRQESTHQQKAGQDLRPLWDALPAQEKRRIEQEVRDRVGGSLPAAFLLRLCLEELGRQQ